MSAFVINCRGAGNAIGIESVGLDVLGRPSWEGCVKHMCGRGYRIGVEETE